MGSEWLPNGHQPANQSSRGSHPRHAAKANCPFPKHLNLLFSSFPVLFLLGKAQEPAALAKALGETFPPSWVLPLWLNFPPLGGSYWF